MPEARMLPIIVATLVTIAYGWGVAAFIGGAVERMRPGVLMDLSLIALALAVFGTGGVWFLVWYRLDRFIENRVLRTTDPRTRALRSKK